MTKCSCGYVFDENETYLIIGEASVSGHASIKEFHNEGISWESTDSGDEQVVCPKCGTPTPMPEVS